MKNINLKKLAMLFLCFLLVIVFLPINSFAANKLSLSKKKLTLYAGMESQTIAVKNLSDVQKVKWTTSNKKIATVKNGKITPKKKGTVTITAKIGKKKLTCKVTVKEPKLYNYTYYSKGGYSSSRQEGSSRKMLFLKVGKDIPAGMYKASSIYNNKTGNPSVYVGTKKRELKWSNWFLHMSNSDEPNGNLIEAKKGHWITIYLDEKEKITLTPIKYVKTFDKYDINTMDKNEFKYAVYKVGRDIPAGEYRVNITYASVKFQTDNCHIVIADSFFDAKSLCSATGEIYKKLKKESNAQTIDFSDLVEKKNSDNVYSDITIDTTFNLKDGQWICTEKPIYKVN